MVVIFIERKNITKKLTLAKPLSVADLLKKIKINPEEVLVVCNDEILTEDDLVKNSDHLKLLSVISGG